MSLSNANTVVLMATAPKKKKHPLEHFLAGGTAGKIRLINGLNNMFQGSSSRESEA